MGDNTFDIQLKFQGHYDENLLNLKIPRKLIKDNNNLLKINLIGNPSAVNPKTGNTETTCVWERALAYSKNMKEVVGPIVYE